MKKNIAGSLLTLTLTLLAQAPPNGPGAPPVDLVRSYLTLTDVQVQQLQQIRQAEATANQTAFQSMQQKQQQLNTALRGGSTDASALGRLLLEIEALRKQVQTNQTTFHNQAVNALNAAQKTKLQTLDEAAKLGPTIQQAAGLGLVTPPTPPAGGPQNGPPGPGPRGMMRVRPVFD